MKQDSARKVRTWGITVKGFHVPMWGKQARQLPATEGSRGSENFERGLLCVDQYVQSFCALYLVLIQKPFKDPYSSGYSRLLFFLLYFTCIKQGLDVC